MQRRTWFQLTGSWLAMSALSTAWAKPPVSFREVESHFTREAKRLRLGETSLITHTDALLLLGALESHGWKSDRKAAILAATLPDAHVLVQKLRTPKGQSLATQVSAVPGGFDRLDHLSRLPDGRQLLDRLIDGPDGYKLIEYLAQAEGGRAAGVELSAAPGGAKFNEPTGKIYTLKQLREQLVSPPPAPSKSKRR
ncbi:MAG: hypothetical protein JNM18_18810 [Planctomycetaceae bacterium]|nr:hypothetical protein [Planctomycetaceae bacterium]